MSAAPARSAHPAAAPAITAFLRGIERRARVLAHVQSGDSAAGDRAVDDAMRAFTAEARDRPLAQWPQQFWSLLLAGASLRVPVAVAVGWGALAPGPRAALLLRWAGGLDDATAARVLGVSPATFRLALRHGLDAAGDRAPALQAEIDARLAAAPPAAARAGDDIDLDRPHGAARPRALLAVLWALLAACVLAFAATFLPRSGDDLATAARLAPLPEASPAARYDHAAALVVHRDFALLVDAEAARWLDDLEFHAWLAAGAPGPVDAPGTDTSAPGFAPAAPDAALETLDAPL